MRTHLSRYGYWILIIPLAFAAAHGVPAPSVSAAGALIVHRASEPLPADALILPADSRSWSDKVAPELGVGIPDSHEAVEVIVSFRQPPLLERLTRRHAGHPDRLAWIRETATALVHQHVWEHGQVLGEYTHIPSLWVRIPRERLRLLAADPRVDFIEPNLTLHTLRVEGNALINSLALHQMGITGAGVGVVIVDTGVDYRHDELGPGGTDPTQSKTIKLWDSVNNDDDPMDDQGHGTAVAGISSGSTLGVAPASRIVAVKVLNSEGSTVSGSLLGGLNKVVESVSSGNPFNIRVLNMSLGGYVDSNKGEQGLPPQPCDSYSTSRVAQALTDMGVLVISSAGNGGCITGVGHPACGSAIMAVGAVYDGPGTGLSFGSGQCTPTGCSNPSPEADMITCYSDSGEQLDVWAPSHRADTASRVWTGGSTNPIRYGFGGTSAAAPYVAGAAALLFEAFPAASAEQIRLALTATGQPITDSRNDITRNRIDLMQAWQFLADGVCPVPTAPLNLNTNKTSVCSGQTFRLRWGFSEGADTYQVQYAANAGFSSPASFTGISDTEMVLHATQETPTTFFFRVRAVSGNGCHLPSQWSASVNVNYTPDCGSLVVRNREAVVTGVARWPGFEPAFWHTDLGVANPGELEADVRVTFLGQGAPRAADVTIPAGEQLSFERVLATLFGIASNDVGTLRIESDLPVAVQSRTYSQAEPGDPTFGQNYPAIDLGQALADGHVGILPFLRSDAPFYTNIELVNVGSVPLTVEVQVLDNSGTELHTFSRTIGAGSRTAVNRNQALPAGNGAAFALVRVLTPGARLVAFASVVDDESKDPTTVPMTVAGAECPEDGCHAVVTGVARWPGFAPAFWHTDLALANPGAEPAAVILTFLGQGGARVEEVTIPGGQQRSWERVLASLFNVAGNEVGTLRVASDVPVAVQSRTYSQANPGDPTFGQNYPAVDLAEALSDTQVGVLPYLRSDPPFYTNLELVNVGDASLKADVRLYDNQGTELRWLTRDIVPGGRAAVNRTNLLPEGYAAAFARIRVLTPGGRLVAFASVVDDESKDPTTVPMFVHQPAEE